MSNETRPVLLYYYGHSHAERLRAMNDKGLEERPGVPIPACECSKCDVYVPATTVLELYEALQGDDAETCEIAGALFKDGWSGTIDELLEASRALAAK